MSIIGFFFTIIGVFACTWIVLSAIWAAEDRKRDHEEWEDENDNDR